MQVSDAMFAFLAFLLLLGLELFVKTVAIELEENELVDLQELLKEVHSSLRDFNNLRQEKKREEINEFKSTCNEQEDDFEELTKTQREAILAIKEMRNIFTEFILEKENHNDTHMIKARDCWDLYQAGVREDGVYEIYPVRSVEPKSFQVYCEMTTDGGGWTVFQRRGQFGNPIDYFYKTWYDYKMGFGDMNKEFWLGNEKIHILSRTGLYELRVDLANKENETAFASFKTFSVANEQKFYRLTVGEYSGTAGDSLARHNQMYFTTKDVDKDELLSGNCAVDRQGVWWYKDCFDSNLNGLNLNGANSTDYRGIMWHHWKKDYYSLCAVESKIRPKDVTMA